MLGVNPHDKYIECSQIAFKGNLIILVSRIKRRAYRYTGNNIDY
jgi:hypothetical protein